MRAQYLCAYTFTGGEGKLGFPDLWSGQKPWMELLFNPCGEFRWSPEGPVSQIHSPHFLVGAPWIFSDLLRFVQMLKESGVWKATGSYRIYSSLVKLQPRFLSLQWKTCLWAELQPWCLSLQWRTCPWGRTLMMIHLLYKYIQCTKEQKYCTVKWKFLPWKMSDNTECRMTESRITRILLYLRRW